MRARSMILVAMVGACFRGGAASTTTAVENQGGDTGHRPLREHAAAIADPLGFLPIDSEAVFFLDGVRLRASAIWRQYEPSLVAAAGAKLADFQQLCKFDPIAAIQTVRVGIKDLGAPKPTSVVVMTGIGRSEFMACLAKAPKAGSFKVEGEVVVGGDATNQFALQYVDQATMVFVMGPKATRATLDGIVASGTPLRESRAFVEMFQLINTQSALWLVVNGNTKPFDGMRAMGVGPQVMAGSVGLVDGLSSNLRIRLDTPAAATQLVTGIQGQLGMVRTLVDRLDISADANDVVVDLAMTDAQLTNLVGMMSGMLGIPAPIVPPTTP